MQKTKTDKRLIKIFTKRFCKVKDFCEKGEADAKANGQLKNCPLQNRRASTRCGDFRLCDLPDKQSTGLFSPKGQICKQIFSICKSPFSMQKTKTDKRRLYFL